MRFIFGGKVLTDYQLVQDVIKSTIVTSTIHIYVKKISAPVPTPQSEEGILKTFSLLIPSSLTFRRSHSLSQSSLWRR
jgi:hypothetical protein